jgi:hypothetical protein
MKFMVYFHRRDAEDAEKMIAIDMDQMHTDLIEIFVNEFAPHPNPLPRSTRERGREREI